MNNHTQHKDDMILFEVDEVIRSMPDRDSIRRKTQESLAWFGRACSLVDLWDAARAIGFRQTCSQVQGGYGAISAQARDLAYAEMVSALHEVRYNLQFKTQGSTNIVVDKGKTFSYFEELRRIIGGARSELFFIDPYVNADFVAKYFPHVPTKVKVRILCKDKKHLSELLSAVAVFKTQHSIDVEIRQADTLHDRYLITDKNACYQSGASFKDGATNAPVTITEIKDIFPAVLDAYEKIWDSANRFSENHKPTEGNSRGML